MTNKLIGVLENATLEVNATITETGPRGLQGEQGIQGQQGLQGEQGIQGEDGHTPVKGVDYFDGVDGKDGEQGTQGLKGLKGDKGDTGNKGDTGEKGDKGDTGEVDYTILALKADISYVDSQDLKQMPISGGVLENYTEKLTTVSASNGIINLSLGNVFQHTPSASMAYIINNAVNGQGHSFTLIIDMSSTVRTLTFPASVKWQGGEIPDMTTASKTYVLTFMTVDGGTNWLGMFGGEF